MVYTKENFVSKFKVLLTENFKLKDGVQATLLIREYEDRKETITISYKDFSPHGFYISGVIVDILFFEVENVINPILNQFNIEKRYGNTTIQKNLISVEGIDYKIFDICISNDEVCLETLNAVKKIIEKGAIPFLDKFKSLEAVNEEIEHLTPDELSKFLSGIVNIKVPLVKKIVNAFDFRKVLADKNKFYKEEAIKYPRFFKDHDKVFNEIFAGDL